jgi:hypothetical protein
MIRLLIRILISVVVVVLVYNYFFGTPDEKQTSQKIFNEVKVVGNSVSDLIKTEKVKFDEGKYDEALVKINHSLDALSKIIPAGDSKVNELNTLRSEKEKAQKQLDAIKESQTSLKKDDEIKQLNKRLETVVNNLQKLSKDVNDHH